jgi:putative membrane protein
MKAFFLRWLVMAIAVLSAAHLIPGIHYASWGALLTASLLLGLINAILKPFLLIISLPLLLLTFGLFIWVINSALLMMVGHIVKGFTLDGWGSAFLGSLVISIVTTLLKGVHPSSGNQPPSPKSNTPLPRSASTDKVIDV